MCNKKTKIKKGLEYTEGLVMLTLTQFDHVEDDRGKLLIRVYHSTHCVVESITGQ